MLPVVLCIAAYFIGSVPFGLYLTRWAGLGDVRAIGSGNIGATNVLRTGRKGLALLTLLLDGLKGALAVWLGSIAGLEAAAMAGVIATFGHCFPAWLRFKGGKGVATGLGALAALHWQVAALAVLVWLVMFLLFRISSLSAIMTAFFVPFFAAAMAETPVLWAALVLSALLIARHHGNIRRLLAGEEKRTRLRSPPPDNSPLSSAPDPREPGHRASEHGTAGNG